jgi:hypothetical protein
VNTLARGINPAPTPCSRYTLGKHKLFGEGCLFATDPHECDQPDDLLVGLDHIGEGIWRRAYVGYVDTHQLGARFYAATDHAFAVHKGLSLRRARFLASLPCSNFVVRERVRSELHEVGGYDEAAIVALLLQHLSRAAASATSDVQALELLA